MSEYKSAKWAFWKAFVELVYRGDTGELSKSEERKAKAVHQASESGLSQEEIIAAGQGEILSRAARNRKKYAEPTRQLTWRVSRSLADAVMSSVASADQDEALVTRLVRVGHLRTSDDLFEFLLSEYVDVSDDELRHRTQVFFDKKRKRYGAA